MKLRLVKFAEYRGEKMTRTYKDDTDELIYDPDRRVISIRNRLTDEIWYADQTGAEWHPWVPAPAPTPVAPAKEPERGGPATPVARQPAPGPQRPKR